MSTFDPATFPEGETKKKMAAADTAKTQHNGNGNRHNSGSRTEILIRAERYLAAIPPAVEGNGGNNHTYLACCKLRDFGLSEEEAFSLLRPWNQQCRPPWSDQELQKLIRNAYSYAQLPIGSKLDEPLLNHGGDYKAAARAIAQQYGMKDERRTVQNTPASPVDEEREAIQQESTTPTPSAPTVTSEQAIESYIEFAPAFLSIEDPPVRYLIAGLLPQEIIALIHGEPRTRKSWAALEIAIALTTGRPAFGLERFSVPEPVPVLYLSQEDGARPVRARMKRLLRGYELEAPDKLALAIHHGIDLDRSDWRARLIQDVAAHGFKLVVFDPIRRFSTNADGGPTEVRAITAFLRQLVTQTGASVIINHHDVKPGDKPDIRRRSHKASGGDWFAASECPIAFEPAGENCSLVYPEDYKFSIDPKPFTFRIEEDLERTWARIIGEDASVEQAADLAAQEKAFAFVAENRGTSTAKVAQGIHIRRAEATRLLEQLVVLGKLDSTVGGRGKATNWFVREQKA